MADLTKTTGQLMDWTLLDDSGAALQTLESGELDVSTDVKTTLHIDVCDAAGNTADASSMQVIVMIQSGSLDEEWHEFQRLNFSNTAPGTSDTIDANMTAGVTNTVGVVTGTNFTIGAPAFIHDGTIANSEIVFISDINTNTLVFFDAATLTHAETTPIRNFVNQSNIVLPESASTVKVLFNNSDADANYAIRIRWTKATDLE